MLIDDYNCIPKSVKPLTQVEEQLKAISREYRKQRQYDTMVKLEYAMTLIESIEKLFAYGDTKLGYDLLFKLQEILSEVLGMVEIGVE